MFTGTDKLMRLFWNIPVLIMSDSINAFDVTSIKNLTQIR